MDRGDLANRRAGLFRHNRSQFSRESGDKPESALSLTTASKSRNCSSRCLTLGAPSRSVTALAGASLAEEDRRSLITPSRTETNLSSIAGIPIHSIFNAVYSSSRLVTLFG